MRKLTKKKSSREMKNLLRGSKVLPDSSLQTMMRKKFQASIVLTRSISVNNETLISCRFKITPELVVLINSEILLTMEASSLAYLKQTMGNNNNTRQSKMNKMT